MNSRGTLWRMAVLSLAAVSIRAAEPVSPAAPPQVPGVNLFAAEMLAARAAISNDLFAVRREFAQARTALLDPHCASWRDQLEQ